MTLRDIDIDCGKAYDKASALSQQANELRSAANTFQSALSKLGSSWSGGSAETFAQRGSERIARMNKQADRLEEIASAIRKSADAYKKREEKKYWDEKRAKDSAKSGGGFGAGGTGGGGFR